jgi:predicted RNA polymerase sigma factor
MDDTYSTGNRIGRASQRITPLLPTHTPSPVVELNRTVALAMACAPAAGLELAEALTSEPALNRLSRNPASCSQPSSGSLS